MFSQVSVCAREGGGLGLCPGGLCLGGLFPGEVSVPGGLCPTGGVGGLCPEVSVQGVLCPGDLCLGGLCPTGGSLSKRGLSVQRGLCHGDPRAVTSGRYASYWNAFLFTYLAFLSLMGVHCIHHYVNIELLSIKVKNRQAH